MDLIRSIPYEIKSNKGQILLKIDTFSEENQHIFDAFHLITKPATSNANEEPKKIHVQILMPQNYSFRILKFMLHRILLVEINTPIANVILSAIYETTICKLKEMTTKFFPNEVTNDEFDRYSNDRVIQFKELTEEEKWILLLGQQIITFEKYFKADVSKIKLQLYKQFTNLFTRFINFRQNNIQTKFKLIEEKESNDFMIKESWVLLKNQPLHNQKIIYIEPTEEFTLKKMGDELDKNLYGILNHEILALMISKMLKMTHVDSYSTVISSKFALIDNNRVTPALEDRNYQIYNKTCSQQSFSAIDCVTTLLFRSCGIKKIPSNILSNIFIALLYSELPFDDSLREYILILVHKEINRNSLMGYKLFDNPSMILLFNRQSLIKDITQGFDDIFEIRNLKLTKETMPSAVFLRNVMITNLVYYLLTHPVYSGIFKIKYVKKMVAKLTSFVELLPIDGEKVKPIIEVLMTSYFKSNVNGEINIKSFMTMLNQNLNKSYFSDDTIYEKYKFVLSDTTETKGFNIYEYFKPLLFGTFFNNCELCDNIFLMCQNNCHIMDCGNHKICIDCGDKIFKKKCYTQGQRVELINFVCPICRQPETNKLYKIPEGFYEAPDEHCLCSYPDCMNIAKMSSLPPCQAAGLDEPENTQNHDNNENHENYCQQHLQLMHLMSYVPVEMLNTVKECPSCHNLINRVEGCSHITCQCGQQFCWVCDYVHENNEVAYSHASYCRGRHTWEKALSLLVNVSSRILTEIKNFYNTLQDNDEHTELTITQSIHQLIEGWLSNDLASPEINAQSFWNFQSWLNSHLGIAMETIIPQLIAEMCEWLHSPTNSQTSISVIASNLQQELTRLKSIDESLFMEL